jgi:hypothetical protein
MIAFGWGRHAKEHTLATVWYSLLQGMREQLAAVLSVYLLTGRNITIQLNGGRRERV